MSKIEGFSYDVESDGFYFESTRVWTIVLKDLNDPTIRLVLNPFLGYGWVEKFLLFMEQYDNPVIVAHNGLGFDIFMLLKHGGIDFTVGPDTLYGNPVQFVDTYYLSMYVDPDADGHSLEAHGERLGLSKIDWRAKAVELGLIAANAPAGEEFKQHHPEMDIYCERDVDVLIRVFWKLVGEFNKQYDLEGWNPPEHYLCGQKNFFLMSAQAITGWEFDKEYGLELVEHIQKTMKELEEKVEPQLPPRKLKKSEEKEYTMPAKPFKKNGEFSSHMLNFIEKHQGEVLPDGRVKFFGVRYKVIAQTQIEMKMPMTLSNQDDLKDWFIEQGWQPTYWNYKRGPDGKPWRDPNTGKLVQTSPKIQEAQKICENLLEMDGDLVKDVVKWLSLRNRLSVLEGWLGNNRLALDGRLSTERTGITPTHRQKHSTVVNVPKASEKVLLGKEFRKLFKAKKGRLIAAGDAAALEGRVQGHYCFKYDGGITAEELLRGDVHSKNAKAFYPTQTVLYDIASAEFNKDDTGFKPYRDRSKNGYYALM